MVPLIMVDENLISRWMAAFLDLPELEPEHRVAMLENIAFNRLKSGERVPRQHRGPRSWRAGELRRRRQCGMIAD
jgi:hypothetical protein